MREWKGVPDMEKRELVIIGAGPAGLTAGIYGRRAGLDTLILERGLAGGQINSTDEIENWPGVIASSGQDLGESFRKHAEHFGVEFRDCDVQSIKTVGGAKVVVTNKGEVEAEAVIIATGANFRKLGCKGEAEYTGAGVSYCAVCDAAFFEEEEVAVVGGGNVAVEEAGYLTRFASKVYLIHRRDEFRADRHAVEQALSNPKIEPVYNTVVDEIKGTDGLVSGLTLRNVRTGKTSELPIAGVFIFVGTEPVVSFLGDPGSVVNQTKGGWIDANRKMETSVEGIFAAGDVIDKSLRQVVTAAGDGAVAAMSAYTYITQQLHIQKTLMEPDHTNVLFFSSIDQNQVKLQTEAEAKFKDKKLPLVFIDGYRNKKIVEKLKIDKLPALLEMKKGSVVKSKQVANLDELLDFIEA
jgi:thioredoxin reductase (NADPH)